MAETKPGFTAEQESYLQGFALGSDVARAVRGLPVLAGSATAPGVALQLGPQAEPLPAGPEAAHEQARRRAEQAGGTLCAEEQAKRAKNGLDLWDEMQARAAAGAFPKGTDVFLTKFHGLFFVAPAQNAYMCRLRFPGGHVTAWQMEGLAELADRHAGGYADVTTRANFQLREIPADQGCDLLLGLRDLGIVTLGAGADNIRNVTASPLSGFDAEELIETYPLARAMHHHILQHRELYGLPRKFNIAFDGGGAISALEDTNDIGFRAVRVEAGAEEGLEPGVYFELALGGITGHRDFARSTGVLVMPEECLAVATAIVRVFLEHGDRTDRKKARLKYVLDAWGFERFLAEVEKLLPAPLRRTQLTFPRNPPAGHRWAHVGIHPQRQPGRVYAGVVLPVGRLTSTQLRGLAEISRRFGSGVLRLTVWQNLVIPDLEESRIEEVIRAIDDLGLSIEASGARSGLVACTGAAGCKYAAADTKSHALQIADYLEERLEIDQPVNIHLTGCHHSCAQHYIGDIGLLATKVERGEEMVEGYHVHLGGGWGEEAGIAREVFPFTPFEEVPPLIARLIACWLERRSGDSESFAAFARRHTEDQLREFAQSVALSL